MVQGVFDDLNPETVSRWKYPDTGKWNADRNTDEFISAMPEWKTHGLIAFTVNFQGGSPEGYSRSQPWENNSFKPNGKLKKDFANRMKRIVKRADELEMVVILDIFYFGQDEKVFASWGFFDFRMKGEGFNDGYQSVPVNWGISSTGKKGFFNKTKEIFID